MDKNYRWRLIWSNCIDNQALKTATEYCATVTLFEHSKAHLINHAEYNALIKQNEIAPAKSHWQISAGRVGLIALSEFDKYTTTWEHVSNCKTDFMAGYKACQAHDCAIGKVLADAQTAKPNALRKAVAKALKALFTD